MTCDRCRELNVVFEIRTPADLRRVINIVGKEIRDGIISKGTPDPMAGGTPFEELLAGANWDDYLNYRFACNHCGQAFRLTAETYHGSGGAWRPEGEQAMK
jgi:phage terminase large subunit GpA-like protein